MIANTLTQKKKRGHLEGLFLFVTVSLCLSSQTVLANFKGYLVGIVGCVCFFMFLSGRRLNGGLPVCFFCAIVAFGLATMFFSLDRGESIAWFVFLACMLLVLAVRLSTDTYSSIMKYIRIGALILSLSILLSVFIKDMIPRYFVWVTANPAASYSRLLAELSIGSFSGLAGEKAEAAWLLNAGLAVEFSACLARKKITWKNSLVLILLFVALVLTAKRMLFAMALASAAILFFRADLNKGKAIIAASCILLLGLFLFVALQIPPLRVVFDRLMSSGEDVTLNGRTVLWGFSLDMWRENRAVGLGFGSYTNFVHIRGSNWNYLGHNIYLQLLGETGVIGLTLFACFFGSVLWKTIKLYPKKLDHQEDAQVLLFSLYIQVAFLLYGFSGNALYDLNELLLYMICASAVVNQMNHFRKKPMATNLVFGGCYETGRDTYVPSSHELRRCSASLCAKADN